ALILRGLAVSGPRSAGLGPRLPSSELRRDEVDDEDDEGCEDSDGDSGAELVHMRDFLGLGNDGRSFSLWTLGARGTFSRRRRASFQAAPPARVGGRSGPAAGRRCSMGMVGAGPPDPPTDVRRRHAMSNAQAFTSEALPLSEQVVLVTGSGRGLGAAIAKAFAPEESALVINYRYSAETAEELAEAIRARGGRAMAVEADVTDSRAVDAMFEAAVAEFGAPVSTVVNNALVDFSFNGDERQPADEIDYSDFADQFRG